jgi:hypothetical protein
VRGTADSDSCAPYRKVEHVLGRPIFLWLVDVQVDARSGRRQRPLVTHSHGLQLVDALIITVNQTPPDSSGTRAHLLPAGVLLSRPVSLSLHIFFFSLSTAHPTHSLTPEDLLVTCARIHTKA